MKWVAETAGTQSQPEEASLLLNFRATQILGEGGAKKKKQIQERKKKFLHSTGIISSFPLVFNYQAVVTCND